MAHRWISRTFILVVFCTAFSASAFVTEGELLIRGNPERSLPPPSANSYSAVTWNIQKGNSREFQKDFQNLTASADFLLLQELHLHPQLQQSFQEASEFQWLLSTAWLSNGFPTGTGILSRWEYFDAHSIISEDAEPISNTPKSSTFIRIALPHSHQSLLILSTHAINFTFLGPFERQLLEVASIINEHEGPILWAGDFNTWNGGRWDILSQVAHSLGLSEVQVEVEPRFLILDHIFTRNLEVLSAEVLEQIGSSDHWPMQIHFSVAQ